MFNKLKEVGGKLRERSLSIRSDSGTVSGASFSSGFICPECKRSFSEAEQLQSHWLVCLKSDSLDRPQSTSLTDLSQSNQSTEEVDLTVLGADELRDLLIETRRERGRVEKSSNEIIRKSGAMSVEVTRLQMELDDVATKCTSMEQMGLTLQETYLAQVKRNEELRELLEQRSMTSPDDVHVLTRELSHLHALLSEKEAHWERRLGEMAASLLLAQKQNGVLEQRLSADRSEALSREKETCQATLTATQLELSRAQEEARKLANQLSKLSETRDQLTQQLTEKQVEVNILLAEKKSDQSQAEIATQLERCVNVVSADKQELIDKIGSEALSGILSDTILKQAQSDLSEVRKELKLARESAVESEKQLISRHSSEQREREAQLTELRGRLDTQIQVNEELKSEVREAKFEERQQANQLIASRGEVGELTNQLTESKGRVRGELESSREQLIAVKLELAEKQTRLSELEQQQQKLTELNETLQREKSHLEGQLTQEQSKCTDLQLELDTARGDFVELNQLIDRKEEEASRASSRAEKSEENLRNTLELKNSLSNQILEMDCVSQQLREQLESKTASCSDQLTENERLSGELEQLEQQLEAGRDGMKKQSEEHESVKSLLIDQKLELQSKVSVSEERMRMLEEKAGAERSEKERLLAAAENEKQLALERGDRNALESAELKNALEQEKTRAHLTSASHQQELRRLKGELESLEGERTRLQGKLDQQFGKMAVMDAKLQSFKDENQQLISQQIERDQEVQRARSNSQQLEVEVGELQSALYEMGREQQKSSLKEAKLADRKWQDDTLVEWCNTCHKKFSLSVRKHHCRNCGKIFCQECTSNQAVLPSNKSRVRVCEPCFKEL